MRQNVEVGMRNAEAGIGKSVCEMRNVKKLNGCRSDAPVK
jgi:hypothetical protein